MDISTWGVAATLLLVNPVSMICFTPAVALLAFCGLVHAFALVLVFQFGPRIYTTLDHVFKWVLPSFLAAPQKAVLFYSFVMVRYIAVVVWPLVGLLAFGVKSRFPSISKN